MKNVLFITYYFPPSGGSGVQRGLKFVKYLKQFGWIPTVLTVDPEFASFPELDNQLLDDVPKSIRVHRTKSWDPYSAYASWTGKKKSDAVGVGFLGSEHASWKEKFARWIRANIFIPDARRGWIRHAVKGAKDLSNDVQFDAVVSTGPPHSVHLISEHVSEILNIPWVADIRDAWPDVAYADMLPTSPLVRKRDIKIRNRVLKSAAARVAVTEDLARKMSAGSATTFSVIRNGFDPDDMSGIEPIGLSGFTLVHTGSMAPARNPLPLWSILSEEDSRRRWPDLKLILVGNVDSTIRKAADEAGLDDIVEYVSYLPHAEALRYTVSADLLLLPINRVSDAAGIVTGKIYEYLASSRPVLGFGDPEGEAAEILSESDSGKMFDYDDVEGIRSEIDEHYQAWRTGSPRVGASPSAMARYSRREQTGQLAELLNEVCARRDQGSGKPGGRSR